jgi:hypothetical protein
MTQSHDPHDTALLEPPGSDGPAPETSPHRMRGFWPLMILAVGGTLALVLWATLATGTTSSQPEDAAVSGYTGDWKDLIGSSGTTGAAEAAEAAPTYTGDWKDSIGSTGTSGTDGATPTYTGDWKDSIGSTSTSGTDEAAPTYTGDWKDSISSR